jgi:hypothetical protein
MNVFVPRQIEGFETTGLPDEILEYLHFRWIHFELFGPNANLSTSWRGVSAEEKYKHIDQSYHARQYKITTGDQTDQTDHSKASWKSQNFHL